eukprot:9221576-Pyramimonas_sp.AAC.1
MSSPRRQSFSKTGSKPVNRIARRNLRPDAYPERPNPGGPEARSHRQTGSKAKANKSTDAAQPWRTPRPAGEKARITALI